MSKDRSAVVGDTRKAKNVSASLCFGGDFESEFPIEENIDWLRQWYNQAYEGPGYLVDDETYPTEIWEQINTELPANHLDTRYKLVWTVPPD
jgi:hypothetical protein